MLNAYYIKYIDFHQSNINSSDSVCVQVILLTVLLYENSNSLFQLLKY